MMVSGGLKKTRTYGPPNALATETTPDTWKSSADIAKVCAGYHNKTIGPRQRAQADAAQSSKGV
ncbi:hypothetical protein ACCT09_09590, partial [Rhizobium ruizarguesonis]